PVWARKPGAANRQGFSNSDVLYLITPDRFANGDPDNDAVEGMLELPDRANKGGRHGGDIAGIRQHLDYIADLGFTAIWLNPVLENNMKTYSYHGYSTTDYYRVDPRFGTNEDYRQLALDARRKGIGLIMDMIVNHCGLEHWWMRDLPTSDWINQWPTYQETNHRKTLLQDPHASERDKKIFTDGWFVPTMPDLNQRNELLAEYLTQNSIWWVEYLGLAGIRMDTYPYPDMYYMSDWAKRLTTEYPNLNIVGEEWFEAPTITSYWQRGKINPNGYEPNLPSVMDFPLQAALTAALTNPESWKTGWITLYETLAHDFLYPDPDNLVIFPDNHDMSRIFTQLNEDFDLYKMAMACMLTMRGIPQLYYGDEILMANPESGDHGLIRSDFPGGWPGDKVNGFTGEGLTDQQKEARDFLKKLLHWRQNAPAVHAGRLVHFVPENGVYVYFRLHDAQKIMVVFNKNAAPETLDLTRFAEI
ncbi:MAG: alpha-amlyase, partial [Bacteroidetes bacterium]